MTAKKTTEQFILESKNIHDDRYDYSEVVYTGLDNKVIIKCNKCRIKFYQTPHNHLRNHNCLNCENINRRSNIYDFILKANIIHKNMYDYKKSIYINTETKIIIICLRCGLDFMQTPHSHLLPRGCPRCAAKASRSISQMETQWLDSINIDERLRQKILIINNRKCNVDAFNHNTNTVYEFYGDYWHGNPLKFKGLDINKKSGKTFGELYQSTIARENLIKQAGYNIVSIWESDWKNEKKHCPSDTRPSR